MGQRFKVEELIKDRQELDELEAFAREPGRTIDECWEWMQSRGYTLSRDAIYNWKRAFDQQQMKERFSRSGELARAMKAAVDASDFDAVADGAVMQLVQVVFEQASTLQAEEKIDPLEVMRMTRSLKNLVGTKEQHTRMLAGKFDAQAQKLVAAKRELTQQDIDEVRKAVFG